MKLQTTPVNETELPVSIAVEFDGMGELAIVATNGKITAIIGHILTNGKLCLFEENPKELRSLGFVTKDNCIDAY